MRSLVRSRQTELETLPIYPSCERLCHRNPYPLCSVFCRLFRVVKSTESTPLQLLQHAASRPSSLAELLVKEVQKMPMERDNEVSPRSIHSMETTLLYPDFSMAEHLRDCD